jgi:hypothetical protein
MRSIEKKGVMGPVISVFVMVLVIAILAGLTFLFIAALKTNAVATTQTTASVTNESQHGTGIAWLNKTTYPLTNSSLRAFNSPSIVAIWASYNQLNSSGLTYAPGSAGYNVSIDSGNYTLSSTGVLTNVTAWAFPNVSVSYSYNYVPDSNANAFTAINSTEAAGAGIIGYLPLIFLAVIFGAILTLVLKIILPYVNLGNQMGGF